MQILNLGAFSLRRTKFVRSWDFKDAESYLYVDLLQDEPVPWLYEPWDVSSLPHSVGIGENESQSWGLWNGSQAPEKVWGLAWQTDGVVHHVKQERQLTADAVLAGAAVVQDQDPEFLGVVKDLWY